MLLLLSLTLFFGCKEPEVKESRREETAIDTGSGPALSEFSVTWGDSSVILEFQIENPLENADYYWGIVETGTEEDPWTGEDCFRGYTLDNGTIFSFCHPITETGAELFYTADVLSLIEASETLFTPINEDYTRTTTHIIDDRVGVDSPCWVWGDNPSYYENYGKICFEM